MKIYDKAAWQIENGIPEENVISHFTFVFNWLNENNLLNKKGKEILDIGIDEEVSLNESLVTDEGAMFLEMCYDEMIRQSEYDVAVEESLVAELYAKFRQN